MYILQYTYMYMYMYVKNVGRYMYMNYLMQTARYWLMFVYLVIKALVC